MEYDHDDDEEISVVPTTPADLAQSLRALGFNVEMETHDRTDRAKPTKAQRRLLQHFRDMGGAVDSVGTWVRNNPSTIHSCIRHNWLDETRLGPAFMLLTQAGIDALEVS